MCQDLAAACCGAKGRETFEARVVALDDLGVVSKDLGVGMSDLGVAIDVIDLEPLLLVRVLPGCVHRLVWSSGGIVLICEGPSRRGVKVTLCVGLVCIDMAVGDLSAGFAPSPNPAPPRGVVPNTPAAHFDSLITIDEDAEHVAASGETGAAVAHKNSFEMHCAFACWQLEAQR